ncbi:MAG: hypothetical protein IPO27_03720 [Bacteroidetes bacterium]|nr:hypothetical protein [Bacteroidota bacterium]
MSASHNLNSLKDTIEKISFQLDFIAKENEIYELDRDVLLNYLREAYSQALQLLNEKTEKAEKETLPSTPSNSQTYTVPESCIIYGAQTEEKIYETKSTATEAVPVTPTMEPIENPIPAHTIASRNVQLQSTVESKDKLPKKKSAASLFESPEVVAGLFDNNASVADNLARSQTQASVAQAMNVSPLEDLKKAIGINEKFLFINELFEGSMQAYTDTIDKLNSAADKMQANHILESLQIKYNWDSSHAAYLRMFELIQRRFA